MTGTSGLTYSDPVNTNVPIDGVPDSVTPISYTTGSPAPSPMADGLRCPRIPCHHSASSTDITGLNVSTVYQDNNPASPAQCTGDAAAWGENGDGPTSPVGSVPITDPTLTSMPATLVLSRYRYFQAPNFLRAFVNANLSAQALTPIGTTVTG